MRVLYFSNGYTPHDRRFLAKIAERGETYFLRLERAPLALEGRPLPDGVRELILPAGPVVDDAGAYESQVAQLRALLDELRPDVVHAGPVPSCGYIAAQTDFHPFVLMSWGSDILVEAERDAGALARTKAALSASDAFLCDCDAVRTTAQRFVPYEDERIFQAAWGIDLRLFHPGREAAQRVELGGDDAFVVLSTRGWEPIHGTETLLRAFALAHRGEPRLRLVMLGSGSLAPLVQRIITEEQLEGVVTRRGQVSNDELPAYFRAADLYLSCTLSDGSSISLLEAMATGLPVIVTDAYGNREWVTNGEHGWLVAPGDVVGVATAIGHAARATREEQARRAALNRAVAEDRADWPANARKLLAAYDYVLGRPSTHTTD